MKNKLYICNTRCNVQSTSASVPSNDFLKRGCEIVLWGEQVAETYTSRSGGCFGTTSPLLLSSEHFTSCVVASFRAYWIKPVEEICMFRFNRDVSFGFGSTAFFRYPHLRPRGRGGFYQWLDWTHTCSVCYVYPWDPHGNIHLLLQNNRNFQRMEVVQYSLLLLALFSYAVIIFSQLILEKLLHPQPLDVYSWPLDVFLHKTPGCILIYSNTWLLFLIF